jgi:hypothetical protein
MYEMDSEAYRSIVRAAAAISDHDDKSATCDTARSAIWAYAVTVLSYAIKPNTEIFGEQTKYLDLTYSTGQYLQGVEDPHSAANESWVSILCQILFVFAAPGTPGNDSAVWQNMALKLWERLPLCVRKVGKL